MCARKCPQTAQQTALVGLAARRPWQLTAPPAPAANRGQWQTRVEEHLRVSSAEALVRPHASSHHTFSVMQVARGLFFASFAHSTTLFRAVPAIELPHFPCWRE